MICQIIAIIHRWQGKEVNCSKIFSPVITDSGVCCAFNLQDDLKESKFSRLVKEMQKRAGAVQNNATKTISPGTDRGLEVIIDRNFDRCTRISLSNESYSIIQGVCWNCLY